ncbi:MAG: C40 family peptidase [Bacteroidales bacterium]|jgi:lipoprotein Spr|nr:C40 family peptidase [Bacteroidales bacterium]MDD3755553.1 C40 family peptidase [Bacteroidales bacterium]HOB77313.1 C40 family peptidase [Bacteroidales bacterium]HPZ60653.1 C40 family peptidase [Bacteroidales bacterium]HQD58153.1 C40 family peptidase [Bacteroidales bacterium]
MKDKKKKFYLGERLIIFLISFTFISCTGIVEYVKQRQIETHNKGDNVSKTNMATKNAISKDKEDELKTTDDAKNLNEAVISFYENKWGIELPSDADTNLIKEIDRWIGVPYKYGGKDENGTDCSGMVMTIYENVYGFKLNRSSYDIIQNVIKVPVEEARFGDLVFFKINNSNVSHVGIYIGDNQFVHASTKAGVRIDSLEMPYYQKRFYMVGRIKEDFFKNNKN